MQRFWARTGRWAIRFSRFDDPVGKVCRRWFGSTNGFGIISWFLFFFFSKLLMVALCPIYSMPFLALLFSLLDLDVSFHHFPNGDPLHDIDPLASCRSFLS